MSGLKDVQDSVRRRTGKKEEDETDIKNTGTAVEKIGRAVKALFGGGEEEEKTSAKKTLKGKGK